jgi:hypothetical protein
VFICVLLVLRRAGIQYVQRHLGISNSVAGMSFGGVTVVCGFAGTAMGGWLLDRYEPKQSDREVVSELI